MPWFTFNDRIEYLRDMADEIHAADLDGPARKRVRWWLEHKRTAPDWFDDRDLDLLVEFVENK